MQPGTSASPDDLPPSSCDVSDACDALGIPAARSGLLRPLFAGCRPLAGRLTTIRLEPDDAAPWPLPQLLDAFEGAAGGLVLIDLAGRTDVQCWGAVVATAARRSGITGALVNGCARDVDALQALGFATYGRGVYPGGMRGRLRFAALNEPVDLAGTRIEPGSFAVADLSGAVFVPPEHIAEVLALAAQLCAAEREHLEAESRFAS